MAVLKWVTAGSSRVISYALDGFEYVVRTELHPTGSQYVLLQRTRWGEIMRSQSCPTQQDAYDLAEQWAAEARLPKTPTPDR